MLGRQTYIDSAGVSAGEADGFVTSVMAEKDIDFSGHVPKALSDLEDTWFDVVITLSPQAHHVALSMEDVEAGDVIYWPAGDPTVVQGTREQRLSAYREVRDAIEKNLRDYFDVTI